MKTATYHTADGSKELSILAENKNGTVDLSNENGTAVVTNCRVTEGIEHGACTIEKTSKPKKRAAKKTTKKK